MRTNHDFPKERLLAYGFQKDKDGYLLERDFRLGNFKAQVRLRDGELHFQLIDKDTGDNCPLIHSSQGGAFLTPLKEEMEMLIKDILKKCSVYHYETSQANRIYSLLEKEFGISFVYLWEKYPSFAVLRNENGKWFALMAEIEGRKVHRDEERIVLLNVRNKDVDPFMTIGVVPAYHMNKRTWVSLMLNDTLTDEFILDKVRKSLALSRRKA